MSLIFSLSWIWSWVGFRVRVDFHFVFDVDYGPKMTIFQKRLFKQIWSLNLRHFAKKSEMSHCIGTPTEIGDLDHVGDMKQFL